MYSSENHSLTLFRSMLKNPLHTEGMNFDVDVTDFPDDDLVWNELLLKDLEKQRQQLNLPILDIDTVTAFNNISLGNYR